MWHKTVFPLSFEEVPKLPRGALLVVAGVGMAMRAESHDHWCG